MPVWAKARANPSRTLNRWRGGAALGPFERVAVPLLRLPMEAGESRKRTGLLVLGLLAALALGLGSKMLFAQIEGDRGIAPVATTGDFEVTDIQVDETGDNAEDARANGWKVAERKAFAKLVAQNGGIGSLGDDAIEAMVSTIEVQHEELAPHRYIATLTVVFDRERAGAYIGASAGRAHSAPLLVIPVMDAGGAQSVFETRNLWQRAWAEFHADQSVIDYVRPNGGGADSLLITAGQIDRRSRTWWRSLLDGYNASGVVMPIARIERQWPGGPVNVTFTARYGPDNKYLGSVTLTARDEAALPQTLAQGVRRLDGFYAQALGAGLLAPDPSLNVGTAIDPALIDAVLDRAGLTAAKVKAAQQATPGTPGAPATTAPGVVAPPQAAPVVYTVQFATPDADAVDAGAAIVRSIAGVRAASTTSLAIGGTSVMRVTYAGPIEALAEALRARGFKVTVGSGALSIRR